MFITFEGIDGCGKSTQVKLLADHLKKAGKNVITLREPGGTPFSEKIRELLLHSEYDLTPVSELMLFESARADLTEKIINPSLKKGKYVISDRFYDSTTAYQGFGRELSLVEVKLINHFATQSLKPHKTFYIRLDPDTANSRTQGKIKDRIENSGKDFYKRLITGFEKIALEEPERIIIIDGNRSVEDIHKIVLEKLDLK